MPHRHPRRLPRLWLMTDERMGEALWPALRALPRGAGVVFRHYATPAAARRALFARVTRLAAKRGLVLIRAGDVPLGRGEDGVHGSVRGRRCGILTWPAHDRREALQAIRAGADLLFVSPIFATRSHPAARAIGVSRARFIARGLPVKTIALGGMTRARGAALIRAGFWGWAGIDAWIVAAGTRRAVDQKRNDVPT